MKREKKKNRKSGKSRRRLHSAHMLVWLTAIILTGLAVWFLLDMIPEDDIDVDALLEEPVTIEIETDPPEPEYVNPVPRPDIDVQHLTINDYSRPGEATDAINYIVIHYLGIPKTTAQENHDYFESLKDLPSCIVCQGR